MPVQLILKFGAILLAGVVLLSNPIQENNNNYKPQIVSENHNIENAQIIANRLKKPVTVWLNKGGHVNIQPADEKPIEPYTIYHSTWYPR